MKAVLFKSGYRFKRFKRKLEEYKVDYTVLDFDEHKWLEFDFSDIDIVIYYPSFQFSSNHPLALQKVYDNIIFLSETHPHLKIYPDPGGIKYYNDKYRQYLYLNSNNYPIPETIPLFSEKSIALADEKLGYPMVLKNRYGAGGGSVYKVNNKNELIKFYKMSKMDLFNPGAVKFLGGMFRERLFYWELIKAKKVRYPFFSQPLLAQKFIKIDKDLKTVTGDYQVVEAHWRHQVDESMWKMNIDGGGTGIWSEVPQEAIDLSVRLAKDLKTSWINIDLMQSEDQFLISEFSPVWHHYAYKENPAFIYKDDYNIEMPLEVSLDLERIIVESLMRSVEKKKK
jgi:glutathione synthase/RimK-type ligase-like ATP-grasp enzyme